MAPILQPAAETKQFGFGNVTKTMTFHVKQYFPDILKMLSLSNGHRVRICSTVVATTTQLNVGNMNQALTTGFVQAQ
jgi:hypothetical protein